MPNVVESLVGREVVELRYWRTHQVRLFFEADDLGRELYAELGEAQLRDASGAVHEVDAGDPQSVAPLLSLANQRVTAADATGGTLTITFAGGSTLRCEPDERYEAWQVEGGSPYNFVVCVPGGEVSYWDERPPFISLDPGEADHGVDEGERPPPPSP